MRNFVSSIEIRIILGTKYKDLGDFARPICKIAQMCARAIYCGRATKFPDWRGGGGAGAMAFLANYRY